MKTLRIGKHSSNDFVVNDDTVSRYHAQLTLTDAGEIYIKDLGSTNGTFIDGKKISQETKLVAGNVVRLGNKVINWQEIAQKRPNETKVSVQPLSGNAGNLGKFLIGRDEKCQIRFAQSEVSSRHAMLEKDPNGAPMLTDLGSTNGTFVNGQRIFSPTVLHAGDIVLLANKFPFAWEQYIPAKAAVPKASNKKSLIGIIAAAVIAVLMIIGGGLTIMFQSRPKAITATEAYDKYNSAVCLIEVTYAYKIVVDVSDQEFAESALNLINASTKKMYYQSTAYGTGFFITQDGKVATNKHVVRPWEYDKEQTAKNMELAIRAQLSKYTRKYPVLQSVIPEIHVDGILLKADIIPNGCLYTDNNKYECNTFSVSDNNDIDVAIIQTGNQMLPKEVTAFIDIKQAITNDSLLRQGDKVYLIGFPQIGDASLVFDIDRNINVKNQIQEGNVTQDRDDINFRHNAATFGGASGSPILNEYGQLVGVHHAGMAQAGVHGFNEAIKVKHLIKISERQ